MEVKFSFENPTEDITYMPMWLYWFLGFHPASTSIYAILFRNFNAALLVMFLCLTAIELPKMAASGFLIFLISLHLFNQLLVSSLKHFAVRYRCYFIRVFLESSSKFWNVALDGDEEHFALLRRNKVLIKAYMGICAGLYVLYSAECLLLGVNNFFYFYQLNGLEKILFVLQFWAVAMAVTSYVAFETTSVAISTEVYVQLKLLKIKFERISHEQDKFSEDLKVLIDHHNFLLGFFDNFKAFGQEIFIVQYLYTLVGSCLELFIITQVNDSMYLSVKLIVFFGYQVFQLGIYSLLGHFLTEAFSDVGQAIYNSLKWYELSPSSQQALKFVIAQTQRDVNLTGYGLVTFNLETLKKVYQTVMSFYTFLSTVNEKLEMAQD